jgi:hypothetical protein
MLMSFLPTTGRENVIDSADLIFGNLRKHGWLDRAQQVSDAEAHPARCHRCGTSSSYAPLRPGS